MRTGKTSSINYKNSSVRVEFDDAPGIISKDLKVLRDHTKKEKNYSMPSIGEDVVCIFLPHDPTTGFIVGSYYSGKNPPVESGKIKYIFFPDGTRLKYDMEASILEIDCVGDINIKSAKNVSITAKNVSIVAETLSIDAATDIKKKMTAIDIDSKKISTPKGDIDLHKHKDAEKRETTSPL